MASRKTRGLDADPTGDEITKVIPVCLVYGAEQITPGLRKGARMGE